MIPERIISGRTGESIMCHNGQDSYLTAGEEIELSVLKRKVSDTPTISSMNRWSRRSEAFHCSKLLWAAYYLLGLFP